jgi:predicted small integral membrane protein
MKWMAWTGLTGIFFGCIAVMLVGMTTWEVLSPGVPRRGLLPLVTTRGDRLFIGLLSAAFLNLAWIGFTELDQYWALGLSGVLLLLIGRYG